VDSARDDVIILYLQAPGTQYDPINICWCFRWGL